MAWNSVVHKSDYVPLYVNLRKEAGATLMLYG